MEETKEGEWSDRRGGSNSSSSRQRSSNSNSNGSRKRGFLENSQLSEKDRRQVRTQERELLQGMRENAQELAKLASGRFQETTETLDEMYENVCYPREANLDASNLDELNSAVAKQSQALGASDLTKYDVADLIRSSRDACAGTSDGFDWGSLGDAAGACFRAAPEISFLFGLMDTQVVQKERKRARRAAEDEPVTASQPSAYTSKVTRHAFIVLVAGLGLLIRYDPCRKTARTRRRAGSRCCRTPWSGRARSTCSTWS